MKKLNIFLASSNELKKEREQFEIEIYRKGKDWFSKGIFLNLLVWEGLSGAMSSTRSQDEYNKFVRESDLFVLLAWTKLGEYTEEEFNVALGQFNTSGKPKIYTYLKETEDSETSLTQFKNRLNDLGHFYSVFTDSISLWHQFNKELDKINLDELLRNSPVEDKSDILIFNAHLTRELTLAIAPYNDDAQQLMEQDGIPGWELKPDISDTAKEIIVYSFAGALGIQLSRLMSIGNDQSDDKIRKYLENCLIMAKKVIQTICFIFLSELWTQKKEGKQKITLQDAERQAINRFFTSLREFGVNDYYLLLKCLYSVFQNNSITCAISPLNNLQDLFTDNSQFRNACEKLELIDDLLKREQSVWDCYEVEVLLTQVLVSFSFLAAYKMESVRRIEYELTYQNQPCYLHRYIGVSLGNDTKTGTEDSMKYKAVLLKNDAVLLYKDRYRECISLSPFIIDINSLNNERGVNIGFYSSRMQNNPDKLRYRYLN